NRLRQQRTPIRKAPLERIRVAQGPRNLSHPVPVAGGPTEGQALLQHLDGVLQVPLGEVQLAERAVGNERSVPAAVQRSETERLLSVAPALGECAEGAQDRRQARPGLAPQ